MSNSREKQFNRRLSDTCWDLIEVLRKRHGLGTDRALIEFLVRQEARELGVPYDEDERWPSRRPDYFRVHEDERSGAV